MCRDQTSAKMRSKRILSLLEGAKMGMRFVASSDWDLFITALELVAVSLSALVFLMMTWQSGDLGPTVVARWIDMRRTEVPVTINPYSA